MNRNTTVSRIAKISATARLRFLRRALAAVAVSTVAFLGGTAQAQTTQTKNNTAGALNAGASYVSGTAPGATDIALFGSTIAGAQTDTLGGSLTLGQLQVVNPGGAISITDAANTLTLNGVNGTGIDMSTATQNLTITTGLTLGAAQIWNVASGRTLTIAGTSLNAGSNLLTVTGAGSTNINGSVVISSTGGITKSGSGTLNISGPASAGTDSIGSSTMTVNGGNLQLTLPGGGSGNVMASTASVALGGGRFTYSFAVNGVNQSLTNLTINAGESQVIANRSGGVKANLIFTGTLTRTVGGLLNARPFDSSRQEVDLSGVAATPLITSNGTAYVTLGTSTASATDTYNDWGAINAAHQFAAAGYTSTTASSLGTSAQNANVINTVPTTTLTAAATDASFRDAVNQATTIDLNGNVWTTGGILVTSTVATAGSIIKDTPGTGGLKGPSGSDLTLIIAANPTTPVPFTISANILDNSGTALTKGGPGTLILSGNNTFTNGMYIDNGVVQVGSAGALNSATSQAINFDGATVGVSALAVGPVAPTLALAGFNTTVASISDANDQAGTIAVIENANGASVSNATLTVNGSATTTFSGNLQDGTGGGTLGITKSGSGTLNLTSAAGLTYTGATTVNGGTLALSSQGASTAYNVGGGGTLNVSAISGGLVIGTGKSFTSTAAAGTTATLTGALTLSGGTLTSGLASGVTASTTQFSSLTLTSGSLVFNITDPTTTTGTAGLISVTNSGGLTINGGVLTINGGVFAGGSTYNITYNLAQYTGALGGTGISALSVNPASVTNGLTYTIGTSGGFLTLNIAGTPTLSASWNVDGNGSFATGSNWNGGTVPNGQSDTANFGAAPVSSPTTVNLTRTVSLNGNVTDGSIAFTSPNGEKYTITQGTGGSLTLDNGTLGSATISVANVNTTAPEVIDSTVAVNLNSNLAVATAAATDKLTIAGVISNGSGLAANGLTSATLTKTGNGTLVLSGANTYGPGAGTVGTNLNGGTIQVANNSALASGDLLFGGNATLQAGAAGLTVANTIQLGNGFTGIISPNGNTFTLSGVIKNALGATPTGLAIGLASGASGTVVLTNTETYSGTTTINTGATLQLGNNTTAGVLPGASAITDNGNLTFAAPGGGTTTFANTITGTGTVTQSSTTSGSILNLGGANSYSGGTVITAGTVQLGNTAALGTGDVNTNANTLDLNALSPTIGALNGSGTVTSSTAGAVTLRLGGNGHTGTFSGVIQNGSGTVSLALNGGTETLSGANTYTGTTNVNGGTLNVTNALGTSATPTGAIIVNSGTTANFNSATVFAPSLNITNISTGTFDSVNITGTSAVTLSGALTVGNNSTASLLSLTGGTLTANSISMGRGFSSYGAGTLAGLATEGLYINGGALTDTTTLSIVGNNSGATMRIDSGSATIGGTTTINDTGNSRVSVLDVNGGTFTSNDTTGAGIQIGGTGSNYAELLVRGTGTLNTTTITFGSSGVATGNDIFDAIGGTTYVGAGGIVSANTGPTQNINLGNNTITTTPILGASANWSSAIAVVLANNSSGAAPIIQAADSGGTAHNITLSGVVSGSGGLNKTGAGTLFLTNTANTYSGTTTLTAGTLQINGINNLGSANYSNVAFNGGTLQYAAGATGAGSTDITRGTIAPTVASGGGTIDMNGNALDYLNTFGNGGSGGLTITDSNVTPGSLTFESVNTYTGLTTIAAGTLILDTANSISASSGVNLSGSSAVFDISPSANQTIQDLSGVAGSQIKLGINTLTAGTANSTTFAGVIQDAGGGSFVKQGTGTLTLSGANTYAGNTTIANGAISANTVAAGATAQSLGEGSILNLGVASTSSGKLIYTGGAGTLDKNINALGNGSDTVQNSGTGLLTLSGSIVKDGTTLTFNGGTSGIKVTGVISGTTANSDMNFTGLNDLASANTYNGPTWIYGGGVVRNDFAGGALPTGTSLNIGTPGLLGAPTSTTTTAGTFDLYGNNQTVAALNTKGTGPYTSDIVTNSGGTTTANSTLTVTGGGTFAGVIQDGAKTTALTVTGGTLNLSGTNTYTGATTVSGGTLNVTGSIGNSAVSVSTGATLAGTGSIGGLTLASGAAINLQDGGTNTLSGTTLSLPSGTGTLSIDVGSGTLSDLLALSGAASLGGTFTVNVNGLTGAVVGNSYTIVTAASGLTLGNFTAGTLSGTLGGDSLSFSGGGTSIVITISGPSVVTNYFFTGATSNDFTLASNYKTAFSGGSVQSSSPTTTSDVFIAATGPANLPPTIGTNNPTINSLSFTSTGAGSSLAGTGTLTVLAASGAGITDSAGGTSTETVSANVALGASQTWSATSSGNTLAVTGQVSGTGTALTIAGSGKVQLGHDNTYTAGTTVGNGSNTPTLVLANGSSSVNSATGSGPLSVMAGATLTGLGTSRSSSAFSIAGNVIAGNGTSSDTTGVTTITSSSVTASTFTNANLTFNLNSAVAGQSSQINVGSTLVSFSGTTLTLNLVGSNIIAGNTPYILIEGTSSSQYSGLGLSGGNGVITSGLSLAFSNGNSATYYLPSYLFVSNGNIEVEVVPEPSTWAMMLGGFALLIVVQIRRRRNI